MVKVKAHIKHNNLSLVLYFFLILLLNVTHLTNVANAASLVLKQVAVNEDDYLIVDTSLRGNMVLESLEIYRDGDDYLLPFIAISTALELKTKVDLTAARVQVNLEGKEYWIDLTGGNSNLKSLSGSSPEIWGQNEFDIYLNPALFSRLLNAEIVVTLSRLNLGITPRQPNYEFPIEKRLNRGNITKRTRINQAENIRGFTADHVILDQYHLITPPTGYVALQLQQAEKGGTSLAGSLSLNADLLYHSAKLTLTDSSESNKIGSFLRLSRTKASPYDKMPLGIAHYSLGDVGLTQDSFKSQNDRGIGAVFYSEQVVKTRKFGSTFVEGNAIPGWEVELYHDGYFISKLQVDDSGFFRFDDLETHYGVNKFKLKLYGPFGEEEIREEILNINGNRLKKGQHTFDGGFVESGGLLLGGSLEDGLSLNSYMFNYDLGLSDSHQLGLSASHRNINELDVSDDFIGAKLQSSFHDLLINTEVMKQVNGGFAAILSGQGRFTDKHRYSVKYSYDKDFSSGGDTSNLSSSRLRASLNGVFTAGINFGYRFSTEQDLLGENAKPNLNSSLGWNIAGLSYSTGLSLSPSYLGGYNSRARFSLSGSLKGLRLSSSVQYDMGDGAGIDVINGSIGYNFENGLNLNSQLVYSPNRSTNKWSVKTRSSWSLDKMMLNATLDLEENNDWNFSLGIRFSLGYDHVNNRFNISRNGAYGGGTLDLNAFLDRNSNGILDSNDMALEGALFGPMSSWDNLPTGSTGRVVLQGLPINRPIGFYGNWKYGATPLVSSYNVYTHSGGYIQEDIPFTIKTDASGYVSTLVRGEFDSIGNIPVQLLNQEGDVIDRTITNFEGYYEFNGLIPGHYGFRVANEVLAIRKMESNPGVYSLSTPERGGYIEMGEFILSFKSEGLPRDATANVVLSEYNYDPAFFEDEFKGNVYASASHKNSNASVTNKQTNENLILKTANRVSARVNEADNTSATVIVSKMAVDNLDYKEADQRVALTVNYPWRLQFAAFTSSVFAENYLSQYKELIKDAVIEKGNSDDFYRLFGEGFSSLAEAKATALEYTSLNDNLTPIPAKAAEQVPRVIVEELVKQVPIETTLVTTNLTQYTIQIAALSDSRYIKNVVIGLDQKNLFISKKASNDGYLVLLGKYKTKQAAVLATKQLPANMINSTWIRPLADLSEPQSLLNFTEGY